MYGLNYGRRKPYSDLNSNPTTYSPRILKPPAPEGAIRFEDDDKESSSDAINSSQEDLSHVWSEDNDSDRYVLRRRSLARRPVRSKNRNSLLSARSMSIVSSEEGEASEYPSSQRSTLESNPELMMNVSPMPSLHLDIPGARKDSDVSGEEEDDDLSVVTLITVRRSA